MRPLYLKQLLLEREISQRKLGIEVNISQCDMNLIVNGKKFVFPSWRRKISEFLGLQETIVFPEYYEGAKEE